MRVSNQPAVIAGTSQAVNRDESKVNIRHILTHQYHAAKYLVDHHHAQY
jgi:hypothetical protein